MHCSTLLVVYCSSLVFISALVLYSLYAHFEIENDIENEIKHVSNYLKFKSSVTIKRNELVFKETPPSNHETCNKRHGV